MAGARARQNHNKQTVAQYFAGHLGEAERGKARRPGIHMHGHKWRALSGPYDYEQIPELIDRSKRRIATFYADMDTRLEDVPFVAGGQFSVADITLLAMVDFAASAFRTPMPEGAYGLRRWYDDVSGRPSAHA